MRGEGEEGEGKGGGERREERGKDEREITMEQVIKVRSDV